MTKINHSFCAAAMLLSGALLVGRASAQPATAPTTKSVPPLSLAELEKLIGGRTTLTLNLKDATLEEAATAISASSGLKVQAEPAPVFRRAPGSEERPMPTRSGRLYSFEAKGGLFWEEFLAWQRAARVAKEAEPPQPDVVLPGGRTMPREINPDLKLFGLRNYTKMMQLHQGNPLAEGRTLVKWPYVMVGTRLTRVQAATLDETGLRPLEDTELGRKPFRMSALPPAPGVISAAPATPKPAPTEAQRWIDGLILVAHTYLDPKIKPVNVRCEVEEAVDDKGNDLRLSNDDVDVLLNAINRSYSGSTGIPVNIPIGSRKDMGEKLVRLRGTLRFTVVTLNQHFETTDLETPTAGSIWRDGNEFAVRFNGLTKTADGWELGFGAEGRGQRLRQLWDQWYNGSGGTGGIFGGPDFGVQLVDDKGEPLLPTISSTTAGIGVPNKPPTPVRPGDSPLPTDITNQVYTETAKRRYGPPSQFGGVASAVGRPFKLIVDLPIERREVVVPFEFTNLPLPPS